mgnify:FL=1
MKKQSALTRLFEYAGNYKYFTMLSRILSVISAWIALVPFYYIWRIMKEVLDVAPAYDQAKGITSLGWSAVGFALLSMIIYIVALMCSHIAAFRIQANMRSAMMHKIVNLPLGFMDRDGSGKIRKIVQESSEATETYLAHQLPDRAGAIATPIGLLVLLVVFDWRLGLLSLVPVVAAFLIMSSMTGKNMEIKMKEYQNSLEEMSSEAVEYIRGIPVVKTFGQSVFSFKRFRKAIDNYEKWVISYTKDMRLPMVGYTTTINAVFAILIAAAFWFSKGTDDKTFLLNLLFYIIITPIITVTLNKIMYSSENKMLVEDALKRVDGILEREPLEQAKEPKMPKDASIVFENVSFRYKDGITDALHGVNLKIEPGEHVAFVGPSGGGKTTLASLIARFFDVTEGKLFVGGVDVREIADEKLMETVSFVFQDSKLLKMSIYDNIRRGKKDATKEQVLHALKEAQCMDIIEKMPQGIDTVIGTRGTYVSGGEAQRLSIARAMLKDAPILILDEATSSIDTETEIVLQEGLNHLLKGRTSFIIAHRLSTIQNADCIMYISDGGIAEAGTHEELLQKHGKYYELYEAQYKSV